MRFAAQSPDWEVAYEAAIENSRLIYRPVGNEAVVRRARLDPIPLSEYLRAKSSGPMILFEQDAVVIHPGLMLKPERDLPPFATGDLQVVDWTGVDVRKESQGPGQDTDSIQARMFSR